MHELSHQTSTGTSTQLRCQTFGSTQHYDPGIYPDPQKFNPLRWIDRTCKPFEFLAFGGGVRRCIGATMATTEMKMALVTWLRRFHFELSPDAPDIEPVHRRNLTMAPSSGISLIVGACAAF